MFYDIYSLENELTNGGFEMVGTPQLDNYKVLEAIKFLTTKVKELECNSLSLQTDLTNHGTEVWRLTSELNEHKEVIRKMGKDYPELVLSYPKFYSNEETEDDNN
jgi:hypothetical protein